MSPRSDEYLAEAHRFLEAARLLQAGNLSANAAGEAYAAMLHAARAALSEEDLSARTHHGVWMLFHEQFVVPGRIGGDLLRAARQAERHRLDSDYRLGGADSDQARAAIDAAEGLIAAIEALFEDA